MNLLHGFPFMHMEARPQTFMPVNELLECLRYPRQIHLSMHVHHARHVIHRARLVHLMDDEQPLLCRGHRIPVPNWSWWNRLIGRLRFADQHLAERFGRWMLEHGPQRQSDARLRFNQVDRTNRSQRMTS